MICKPHHEAVKCNEDCSTSSTAWLHSVAHIYSSISSSARLHSVANRIIHLKRNDRRATSWSNAIKRRDLSFFCRSYRFNSTHNSNLGKKNTTSFRKNKWLYHFRHRLIWYKLVLTQMNDLRASLSNDGIKLRELYFFHCSTRFNGTQNKSSLERRIWHPSERTIDYISFKAIYNWLVYIQTNNLRVSSSNDAI